MSIVLDMDELQDFDMASRKASRQKKPIIELSPDREEVELEMDIGIPGPSCGNMKCCMELGIVFKWGDLYQMFWEERYPKIPLPLGESNSDEGVYQSIKHSQLHKVVSHSTMFSCVETIACLISWANIDHRLIRDIDKKAIASFETSALDLYYKFPTTKVDRNDEWMLQFPLNCKDVTKSRWVPS